MLILTRRVGESVVFGDDSRLVVVGIRGEEVRLAVVPPDPGYQPAHRLAGLERMQATHDPLPAPGAQCDD